MPPPPLASLPLPPPRGPPPGYRHPVLIGTYSHLPTREISHDDPDASMAYYRPAAAGADLSYGFERRVERDEAVEEHLDGLCEALGEAWGRETGERVGGIVTWRGMMTRIFTAPFDNDPWEMTCIPLGGSVYMELYEPRGAREDKLRNQASWALPSYMGYAFESFSTTTGDDDAPGWSGDVNTNVQWCNVVRSAIGDIPLLLGGEVDCVDAEPGSANPGLAATVELKTNKVIDSEKADHIFHKKLLKHWAQSFLLGVPIVEVGFRNDTRLVSTQRFATSQIPAIVAASPRPAWSPAPCLTYAHAAAAMVVRTVLPLDPHPPGAAARDAEAPLDPAPVFRLRFTPRRGMQLFRMPEDEVRAAEEEGRWGGVLTQEYVRWRMSW